MALIQCPECGKENVSDTAVSCPNCGFNISKYYNKNVHIILLKTKPRIT